MTTLITGVFGGSVEPETGDILLGLTGKQSEKPYSLQIHRGVVAALIGILVGLIKRSTEKHGPTQDLQTLALTGTQQFKDPHGYSHIILILEDTLYFPIALDKTSLAGLQTALSTIEQTGNVRPQASAH